MIETDDEHGQRQRLDYLRGRLDDKKERLRTINVGRAADGTVEGLDQRVFDATAALAVVHELGRVVERLETLGDQLS